MKREVFALLGCYATYAGSQLHPTLRNIPEERRSRLNLVGRLKFSRNLVSYTDNVYTVKIKIKKQNDYVLSIFFIKYVGIEVEVEVESLMKIRDFLV